MKNHHEEATARVENALYKNEEFEKPSSYRTIGQLLGSQLGTLLQQGANGEPKAIGKTKLILQFSGLLNARVGIIPLSWRHAAQDKHANGDTHVGETQPQPNLAGERRHEGEELGRLLHGLAKQNSNACGREKSREERYIELIYRVSAVGVTHLDS